MNGKFQLYLSCFILLFFTLSFSSCKPLSKDNSMLINIENAWYIYPSSKIGATGKEISTSNFQCDYWVKTDVPKTVLAALVENGFYKDPYFGLNMENISSKQFEEPWWYRKEFEINAKDIKDNFKMIFEGLNYKANIWLNGQQIASQENVEGAFGIFEFNITDYIKDGKNVLAVEIIPPVTGDLTIGFVDWNPNPPDKNMGLWRGVKLKKTSQVSLDEIFVRSKINLDTYNEAFLTISANLNNYSQKPLEGTLECNIGDVGFSKEFSIEASGKLEIILTPEEIEKLHIKNPRLWWPNNLGEPYLYNLSLKVIVDNEISDKQEVKFGIREVEDYINEGGHRGYKINGKKVVIKGAGWVDDLMLNDSDEKVIAQIEYAKHMNLNTIRLEGFWGKNKTLYDAADENGILLMIGWSCQWEWTGYCGRKETKYMCIDTPRDIEIQSKAYIDQVKWLRNHPSIFVWVLGSDKLPSPELEKKMNELLKINDPSRPVLSTCKGVDAEGHGNMSVVSGNPGVKMLGPYDYVPPVYWYVDTKLGGAYGFNTETGPGPQVPPLESIKRMIPEEYLWPINKVWDYHCGRNEFNTLNKFLKAFNNRYGEANSLEEFAMKSQISNYEAMRPMFEAFGVNKHNSTGVIQWMYNSAWPEMFWQLFDHYLMPNGAFYGAKKACQPLNLIYNYKDKNIYIVNDYDKNFSQLTANIKVLDSKSKLVLEKNQKFDVGENLSKKVFEMPDLTTMNGAYFLNLELRDEANKLISDNFYWLSPIDDVMDFDKSQWHYTPIKSFANLTALNSLPKSEIKFDYKIIAEEGKNKVEVTIENVSDYLAFFIELKIVDNKTNESVLPIFWSDNYLSLLPRESKKLSGSFSGKVSKDNVKLLISGWNTENK